MIRVASVPASHPYVRAITPRGQVSVLPDPQPLGRTVPGQWWPPRWLEPAYLRRRIAEIDVLHVHFGFENTTIDELSAVVAILAAHGVPLILTIHDLHNPHFHDPHSHRERLDVLVPAAAAVITLTQGAAETIYAQWRRRAVVLPHPHLLALPFVGAPRARRRQPIVALHAKHLRANVDPWPLLNTLSASDIGAALRLDVDDNALTSSGARDLPDQLKSFCARGVDVRVHPPFTDSELRAYLQEIDVLVLPYRFGTHSGWVELCHDAGVRTAVPDCGHFHEQHRAPAFRFDATRFDPASLLAAVASAVDDAAADDGAENPVRRRERALERRWVRRRHFAVYREAIAEQRSRE